MPLSATVARHHPPTASEAAIRAACEARAAAAALAHAEDRETMPCDPVVTDPPPVGGFHPEPFAGPRLGTDLWTDLRDWSGIIAQGAAFLLLAAFAFGR
jgi:hypothetical protein